MLEKVKLICQFIQKHGTILEFENNQILFASINVEIYNECLLLEINPRLEEGFYSIDLTKDLNLYSIYHELLNNIFTAKVIENDYLVYDNLGNYFLYFNKRKESNVLKSDFYTNINNLHSRYLLYNFLKSDNFSDHHNDANYEIIIYNQTKGIFKINYQQINSKKFDFNIEPIVINLINIGSPVELKPFFKNALFEISSSKISIHINEIISQAKEIIELSQRNYDLVSKQFDFDKFKDSLYKEKEKYFTNIREIVNKIFSQAIGIPLSISAAVFTTYKVSNDVFMLLIIWISYITYVIFYIKIQMFYKGDLLELKSDFNNDFSIIKSKSGLSNSIINFEKDKIENKLKKAIGMIGLLIGITFVLSILFSIYIIYLLFLLLEFNC